MTFAEALQHGTIAYRDEPTEPLSARQSCAILGEAIAHRFPRLVPRTDVARELYLDARHHGMTAAAAFGGAQALGTEQAWQSALSELLVAYQALRVAEVACSALTVTRSGLTH